MKLSLTQRIFIFLCAVALCFLMTALSSCGISKATVGKVATAVTTVEKALKVIDAVQHVVQTSKDSSDVSYLFSDSAANHTVIDFLAYSDSLVKQHQQRRVLYQPLQVPISMIDTAVTPPNYPAFKDTAVVRSNGEAQMLTPQFEPPKLSAGIVALGAVAAGLLVYFVFAISSKDDDDDENDRIIPMM